MGNKKIYVVLVILIISIGGFYYFKKSENPISNIKAEEVAYIMIADSNNGHTIEVNDKEDINKVITNIQAIDFKKDKSAKDIDGTARYSIRIGNTKGELSKGFGISSKDEIVWNDYFYKDKNSSIDYDFIESLFSKYKSIKFNAS